MTCCNGRICRVPPAPEVMAKLHADYQDLSMELKTKITFREYLETVGFVDPSVNREGMDDGSVPGDFAPGGPQLFNIPQVQVQGQLRVMVLLVDFADRVGVRPPEEIHNLLFTRGQHATGSMADYYAEVSGGKIAVTGEVHGWIRLPRPYSAYVNDESGMGNKYSTSYPNNAQAMAEDAVRAALGKGIVFSGDLDVLQDGSITALFIVHAGPAAEVQVNAVQRRRLIWSHKWYLHQPVAVAPGLEAVTYLTVAEDCRLGVCAHELGHLAFQWDDFYDANYNDDQQYWDGTGLWDLMAGGSYNNNSLSPAHPAGVHKAQHGWIGVDTYGPESGEWQVTLQPYDEGGGSVVRIRSSVYDDQQYLLLENRGLRGFDRHLPGGGLLVWRVDERLINTTPRAGMFLLQADGKNDLENPNDLNQGDAGDPFPGAMGVKRLGDVGSPSTTFPGQHRSGVSLSSISQQPDGSIRLKIKVK